jgi:short subunit dehydrogenase-like uncharacterized protein
VIILYGATGFTGRLVAAALAEANIETLLAGRNADAVAAIAAPLGLDSRVATPEDLDLAGATALLNCAGPFAITAPPLIHRCLDERVHYLDLAGEVPEHRLARAHDDAARAAGIMVMPGVGFGIVPSDCLLAHVTGLVGEPATAQLALKTVGGVSRGTAEVVLGNLRTPGWWRQHSTLAPRRPGAARLEVDFGDGDGLTPVVTNPWRADLLASAPAATQLEAFMAFPAPIRALMRIPHGGLLRVLARRLPAGPSQSALDAGRSAVWARAQGTDGNKVEAVLTGPDAYRFTALTATACSRRVAAGAVATGFRTPADVWGPDFISEIPGVQRDTRPTGP